MPPINEFVITRIDLKPGESEILVPQSSPCILLITEGTLSLSGMTVSAGATYLEASSTNTHAEPLQVSVSASASEAAQIYRVYTKDTF